MAQDFVKDWQYRKADHESNLAKWGKGFDIYSLEYPRDSTISQWIAEFCGRYDIFSNYFDSDQIANYSDLAMALRCFDPQISRVHGGDQIIIYESAEKKQDGKRLALKPGKAIRRIIPTIPDRYLEKAVTEFMLKFNSANYQIIWGETRDEFVKAYHSNNFDRLENINTTTLRKSLIASCMTQGNNTITGDKYQSQWGDLNPGAAYASPDFRVVLAYNVSNKKIAARCIVRVDQTPYAYAPIYGTNENVIDLIQSELQSKGARPAKLRNYDEGDHSANFIGARLACVSTPSGYSFFAPYQDCVPGNIDLPEEGDEFVTLSRHGNFALSGLSGIAEYENCSESSDPQCDCGDDGETEHNGTWYCESCYQEEFGICEDCDDTTPHDELTTCYTWNHSRHYTNERTVCDSCRRQNYTEIDCGADQGDYWRDSDVMELHDGDTISIREYYNGEYFTSDHSDSIFPIDERVETEDGETIAQCEAEEMGLVELDSGQWGKPDLSSIAGDMLASMATLEGQAERRDMESGQYSLLMDMPRRSNPVTIENDLGEFATMGGLIFWNATESETLAEFPAIGKLETESGGRFYFFKRYESRIRADEYHEFATLAECVSAFRQIN